MRFQDLRAMSMTDNKRKRVAIPHQSNRILSCPADSLTPRWHIDLAEDYWEKKPKRRNGHGIARAIENLRGVRKPLVPCPN